VQKVTVANKVSSILHFGPLGAYFGPLGAYFGPLGAYFGPLGAYFGPLGAYFGPLGAYFGPLVPTLARAHSHIFQSINSYYRS
jgi:hypothetical protein